MNFKDFLDLYNNWNGLIKVNDDNLDTIIEGRVDYVYDEKPGLHYMEVVSFGFYDNEMTVRVR